MEIRKFAIAAGFAAASALAACATSGDGSGEAGGAPASASKGSKGGRIECGGASYYADSLAGNATASGEPYKPSAMTAAHKTLPLGTSVRVVRTDGGGEVVVRINDRGPFTPGRVIDLSRKAAERIDLVTAGVAEVCLYKN